MAINYPYSLFQTLAEVTPDADNVSDMQSDPTMIIIMAAISIYVFKMWLDDFKAGQQGKEIKGGFPGATPAPMKAVWIAIAGALVILGLETGGEIALGITGEQSDITWLFLISIITAAFVEELIFRGFLVVDKKGKAALIGSAVGFSLLFTIFHPFFWDLDMPEGVAGWQIWQGTLVWDFSLKPWFTSAILFINSLWFYYMRFTAMNPQKSLIPCMAAHCASNVGVFVIKLAQGHVVGLY
ncbi:CPBP family intramembrane glutamic endopeptidase [Cerasicoccus frondis]|uniref:CPBP family intramembrane glutamic endopeptidase n=1 Tax=Cerasicoccus frondis TaxID=490090 RepID=UPI0028526953|nr:CPBP family intramembrane glutamic endopeptidase [Cerasicoccus frondis]